MSTCKTCDGERTVIEFRRFAGEYMAGEPYEVPCPDCDGECESDDDGGKTLEALIAERPDLKAYRDELRASLWGVQCLPDPMRRVA